jgi:hypothetical protein
MALGKYKKTPSEIKKYTFDYVDWLDDEEYLYSLALDVLVGNSGELIFDIQDIGLNETEVSFFVGGGVSGSSYDVQITATTTAGQIKQDLITFNVKAL